MDNDNYIDFNEFMIAMGVRCRGPPEEKLKWMFAMFDINNDGTVTKQEMISILRSLYKINEPPKDSSSRLSCIKKETPDTHTNKIFASYDRNNDGVLTLAEFLLLKESDPKLMELVYGKGMVL